MRKETRQMLKIGGPVIMVQLLQMSMNFIDTVMAGNLSADTLAAVAIGGAVFMPLVMLVAGILMAINPIVAHRLGGRNFSGIGINTHQGL